MSPDDHPRPETRLSRRASLASDIAGYLLAGAIIFAMFALSGSLS
ncbi:MAG: hypothetical protein RID15_17830 [Marinovum algicola]|jgi:hypothetical protein|uniref:Uncharacterized protein n=1 Tax=Marinovum algicola TaxID=42444 RepID=A0A975WCY2_9RHOB|nr:MULTISPECIES: hypothetical protein [Marinovum]AKP00048.1 hypothetical protein MALG_04920 [Marinovum algicola DG 898]MDD9745131.1 hypothetical protein [Marinovum sp. PR37]SEJ96249.1 hypothetical protein SAMN04487940_11583 [Marinovum algicola]SLN69177.1 hypothetical protein MAA5396_03763 [Marinovum algicola]